MPGPLAGHPGVDGALPAGFSDPLQQWPLYAAVVVGPAGFLLSQNAFQAGTMISPVLAVITAADPLVSIGVAHVWLGETITSTPLPWRAKQSPWPS